MVLCNVVILLHLDLQLQDYRLQDYSALHVHVPTTYIYTDVVVWVHKHSHLFNHWLNWQLMESPCSSS